MERQLASVLKEKVHNKGGTLHLQPAKERLLAQVVDPAPTQPLQRISNLNHSNRYKIMAGQKNAEWAHNSLNDRSEN
jgi:hypothetical protein